MAHHTITSLATGGFRWAVQPCHTGFWRVRTEALVREGVPVRLIALIVTTIFACLFAATASWADPLPQGASTWRSGQGDNRVYTHIVRHGNKIWLGAAAWQGDATCYSGTIAGSRMRLRATGGEGGLDKSLVRVRYRLESGALKLASKWNGQWTRWGATSHRIATKPKLRQLCKNYGAAPVTKYAVCRANSYPFSFLLSTQLQNTSNANVRKAVLSVQEALRGIGVRDSSGRPVIVDGSYGPQTASAVRTFQRQADLIVDGEVGSQTWRALARRYC